LIGKLYLRPKIAIWRLKIGTTGVVIDGKATFKSIKKADGMWTTMVKFAASPGKALKR
jgi:hypothetical protein